MKTWQIGLVVAGTLSLASCSSIIQKAADNTAVSVLPLSNAKLTGTMKAAGATPLSLSAQANYTASLSSSALAFGDFDPSTLPSALQNPSGLDIPIVISSATLTCTPGANPLTMTVNSITLTVSDTPHGSKSVTLSPNTILTLTKTSTGYSAPSTKMLLKAKWSDFKAIVVKSGDNTPNTAVLTLNATFNDGVAGCAVTLNLASPLQQNVRF